MAKERLQLRANVAGMKQQASEATSMAERRKPVFHDREQPVEQLPILREVGGVDHVPGVSMSLRTARLRAGYDVREVAEVLRIKPAHIEALEAGKFNELPGSTYVTGFLRTYAAHLGLDRDEIIARYREEIGQGARQKLSFPTPSYERRVPRGWLVVVAVLLVAVAFGGWHYYSTQNTTPSETVADLPDGGAMPVTGATGEADTVAASVTPAEQPAAPSEEPALPTGGSGVGGSLFHESPSSPAPAAPSSSKSSAVSPPSTGETPARSRNLFNDSSIESVATETMVTSSAAAATAAEPTEAATPPAEDEVPVASAATLPAVTPSAEPAAVAASPALVADPGDTLAPPTEADIAALEGEAAPIEAAPTEAEVIAVAPTPVEPPPIEARIVISAKADSWVQIQGPENEIVMTQILRPGERYVVPERSGLTMVTGNAGGLQLIVDGQPVGSLGPMGVVKRNIALDADRLRATYGTAR
jgi:cytoskeleton protein RodZ